MDIMIELFERVRLKYKITKYVSKGAFYGIFSNFFMTWIKDSAMR